jgi:hypothetical protein
MATIILKRFLQTTSTTTARRSPKIFICSGSTSIHQSIIDNNHLDLCRSQGHRSVHLDSNYSSSSSFSKRKKVNNKNDRNKKYRGRQSYRFIDRTRVQVSGGTGGNGSISMYKIGRKHKRRPDGGHGGRGGSVLIIADPNEQSLKWTKPRKLIASDVSVE